MKKRTVSNFIETQTDAKNTSFSEIIIQKSAGSRLYDNHGNAYIDLSSQTRYNLLGHNISDIQESIKENLTTSQETSSIPYENQAVQNLCQKLQKELSPKKEWNIEILESSTNAIDRALYTAFQYWHSKNEFDRKIILTFAHANHGNMLSAINLNASFSNHNHFQSFLIPTEYIPYPSTWHLDCDVEIKEKLALKRLEEILIDHHQSCAAMVMEPLLQSKNGMQACRPTFLNAVIKILKKYNLLIISDERFLSPMRSGHFFAHQFLEDTPDITVIGNSLTNNITPIGVVISLDSIQIEIKKANFYQDTEKINKMAIATATKTMEILQTKLNIEHVNALQKTHMHRLCQLYKQPIVENIRYLGSIGAFDIICEDRTKQKQMVQWFYNACTEKSILIEKHEKSICLSPPLCLSIKDLNQCYDLIESIMQNMPLKYIASCIST